MVKSIKSEPSYISLSIIDRAIRTIRDIAYNMNQGEITPKRMRKIIHIYNNAPHKTWSKYAGQLVWPDDVDNDELLELFIVRCIQQENFIFSSRYGYDLLPGEEVVIYNERNNMVKRRSQIEPGRWFINERIGNKYTVKDELGNVYKVIDENGEHNRLISRYKLHSKNIDFI